MNFSKTSCLIAILFLAATARVQGQGITPFIINSAGGAYQSAGSYMQYEWSLGELAVISTYTSSSLVTTNGVLQPCTENVSAPAYTSRFADGELRLFPNPTPGKFELNIAVLFPGRMNIALVNATGQIIVKRNFRNECCGRIEYFDISAIPNGIYMLVATLVPDEASPADNKIIIRRGTIKVIKIPN